VTACVTIVNVSLVNLCVSVVHSVKARLAILYLAFERLVKMCLAIPCLYFRSHPFGIYLFGLENKHKTVNKVQIII
jgi:hypothetical protein